MSLFDKLVTETLRNNPKLSPLRVVVEKELLHHDILRIMRDNHLTSSLTFIGGTCLRSCYGGIRLSEDLDFTGGSDFTKDNLSTMSDILTKSLERKYNLSIHVSDPKKDTVNVDTWKIRIETRGKSKNLPAQRINIDICALPSYERKPMVLLNHYKVDMGTAGLILQVQSLEEIFIDKLIAFALRPNRIKYRDIWDIIWLHGQNIKPRFELLRHKLTDRKVDFSYFLELYMQRISMLKSTKSEEEFKKEMQRFLPKEEINKIYQEGMWIFITNLLESYEKEFKLF